MTFRQITFTLFSLIVAFSVLQVDGAEEIRLCGRRLADILRYVCERRGGFHTPRVRRDASNADHRYPHYATLLALTRKSTAKPKRESEMASIHQRGVVDECCRKHCTLATLVSYCANVEDIDKIDLSEILSSETENMPIISEEREIDIKQVQEPSVGNSRSSARLHASQENRGNRKDRPSLGLSNRNRSVFIVLPRLQEDEDRALGEYRF